MPVDAKPLATLWWMLAVTAALAVNAAVVHLALLPVLVCVGLLVLAFFDVRDGDVPLWSITPLVIAAAIGHEWVAIPAVLAVAIAVPWLRAHPGAIGAADLVVMVALPAAVPPWWGYGAVLGGLLLSIAYERVYRLAAVRTVPFLALAGVIAALLGF